MKTAKW